MRLDVYGSRSLLMNLLKLRSKLNIKLNEVYIGTTIDSQMKKEYKLERSILNEIVSEYEVLELMTDVEKRFRRFHDFSKSNILIVDFIQEGKNLAKFSEGTFTVRPVLKRYGFNLENGKVLFNDKANNIERYVDRFLEYTESYDLIVLSKMRTPKYLEGSSGEVELKPNFAEVNFLNYYAMTFEELLIEKSDKVRCLPDYTNINDLNENYMKKKSYNEFFENELKKILNEHQFVN